MTRWAMVVMVASVVGCAEPELGASVEVDGTIVELSDVDTLGDRDAEARLLMATTSDGAVLFRVSLPEDARSGAHTCRGQIDIGFRQASGEYFSSMVRGDCSFDLDISGARIEVSDLHAIVFSSDLTTSLTLDRGSIRADRAVYDPL